MILAVDIGNTNVVLGGFEKDEILFVERLSTNPDTTALEYTVVIKTTLELNGLDHAAFEGAIISSVVPSLTQPLENAVFRAIKKHPLIVGPGLKTGLNIKLDNPAQLGSDRVADAVGAINNYACPVITIDMGTATTVSVIDQSKSFLGGMIIPGLRMSLEALSQRAAQLPRIALEAPEKIIGKNTVECMQSGIIYYTAAGLDGAIDLIEEELGQSCTVVSTGGMANYIVPHCRHEIIIDEQLLLKGLMSIYYKNQ